MQDRADIVVVGGGYAGVYAATRAARALGGRGVALVSPDDVLVERIRLHEHVVTGKPVAHALSRFLDGTGVEHVRARVVGIDTARRRLVLDSGTLDYARVVLAVGSEAALPDVPGLAEHAFMLDPGRAVALRRALDAAAARRGRVVVCGGGLTGIEVATELAEHRPELGITLVTAGEVGEFLSPRGRAYVRTTLSRLGVTLREGARAESVHADHVVVAGTRLEADVCIVSAGFRASPLVAALGLRTNRAGQAIVDETLRAIDHDDVFVAGDAAAPCLDTRALPLPMGCKTALPQGAHVADNVVASLRGAPMTPFTFPDSIFCVSLGRRDALIQRLTRDGAPIDRVITGRVAAFVKELICRGTVGMLLAGRGARAVVRAMLRPEARALPARAEHVA